MTAESNGTGTITITQAELQWGRGHVTAERMEKRLARECLELLQWGRGHVTAESPFHLPSPRNLSACFNGAAVM